MFKEVLKFIGNNWSDIFLILVGFSAFVIYFLQKNAEKKMAATLILGQIDSIEKVVNTLREAPGLNNVSVYNVKPVLKENMWEKYKHLFVQTMSTSEYELVQTYFDKAEQFERIRENIVNTIYSAWSDKSSVEHQMIGQILYNEQQNNGNNLQENLRRIISENIEPFQNAFRPLELVFTPNMVIDMLLKNINSFCSLFGTTAYQKLQRKSYIK